MGPVASPEVELAAVKAELRNVIKSLDEVKAVLAEMRNFGHTLTQIAAEQKAIEKQTKEMDERIDSLEARQTNNTAFLNKLRGSITTGAWVARIVQALLIAAIGWLYTTMMTTRDQVTEVQHQVKFLERDNQQIIQELIKPGQK